MTERTSQSADSEITLNILNNHQHMYTLHNLVVMATVERQLTKETNTIKQKCDVSVAVTKKRNCS